MLGAQAHFPFGESIPTTASLPLVNPGFESGGSGWTLGFWGCNSSITTLQYHSGGDSLAQTGAVTGGSYQDLPGLVQGNTYQISVWVRADAGTSAQMMLWVHDTQGNNTVQTTPFTPGTTWQQVSLTYTADSTRWVRIHLYYGAGSGTVYYDDVQVQPSSPSGYSSKWLFTSYERDAESGNDYAMARYYMNRLGRFASLDSIAGSITDPQTLNRYAYVRNDPISLVDPSGLDEEESCAWFGCGGAGGADSFCLGCDEGWAPQDPGGPPDIGVGTLPDTGGPGLSLDSSAGPLPPLDPGCSSANCASVTATASPIDYFFWPFPSGTNQQAAGSVLSARWNALGRILLKSDCAKFFGGSMAASSTLLSTSYRILPMGAPAVQNGRTSATGASTVPGTTQVFINSQGPFFNPQMQVPGAGSVTLDFGTGLTGSDFGALLLLHELGHETSNVTGFKPDAGNSDLNRSQTQKVLDKCFPKHS